MGAEDVARAAYLYVRAFTEELERSGVRHVCLTPGSRSTPLALCLAERSGLRLWPLVDERSAAFFALGMARALREPVAVLCTSGTAAANFYPAIIEARYGRVPLVVLTADRPHELREVGAPQAIDQLRMFGFHVKWFVEMAIPEASVEMLRYARTVACRAVAIAREAPAGPVHLNFPFREPLVPTPSPAPDDPRLRQGAGSQDLRAYTAVRSGLRVLDPTELRRQAADFSRVERGLIVCGPQEDPDFAGAVAELAAALGFPVLADPLSQVRWGRHDRRLVVDAYDAFLRDFAVSSALEPELIIRFGAMPTSKALAGYLRQHAGAHQVVVDEACDWRDPTLLAAEQVVADPLTWARALGQELRQAPRAAGTGAWAQRWLAANRLAREAIDAAIARQAEPNGGLLSEARLWWELAGLLGDGATLFAGNSMPVRDLDSFFPGAPWGVRFMANRGANGIDGVVSSALGAAAAGPGPLVLAIGDLSFYHDLNGLLAARKFGLAATVVLIHNDGGGIFSFLPHVEQAGHFEELFAVPLGLDFRPAVEMYGGRYVAARSWEQFRQSVREGMTGRGLTVVEVRTDRHRNVREHQQLWQAVAAAVRPVVGL